MSKKTVILIMTVSFLLMAASAYAEGNVKYPEGYRFWTHVKSMTIHKGHPLENPFMGIHHVYANKKGLEGIKSGSFADGSILVFDLLESINRNHASIEGKRILVGVMVKDQKKYKATGGWGFEGFAENSKTKRLVHDGGKSCYNCHASQQKHDYVFSRWRP
ncbi:MAG: cytochrome C [Candidatus Dadabacteria bacterium]|nr:MAG: cytochrome C [Candidatus Dadabacteria bacterium]